MVAKMNERSSDQIQALVDAAISKWSEESLGEPKATSWGMFSYGDAPAGIGGGIGTFSWFNNKTAMLKFLPEVLPYAPRGPGNSDPLLVAEKVQGVLAAIKAGDLDLEKARKKLNSILRSYSQIEWMGTFKDLKNGNGTYPKKIIKEFRRVNDLTVGLMPIMILRSQVGEFREFLSVYGC